MDGMAMCKVDHGWHAGSYCGSLDLYVHIQMLQIFSMRDSASFKR